MKKIYIISSGLLVLGIINIVFIPTISFVIQKIYISKGINLLGNEDDFIYSGYLLRYFIYKSSNISSNKTIKKIESNIISNKKNIYKIGHNIKNVKITNKNLFETSLISSIVNISLYGMSAWKEFFAEAYSKWTTTPDDMKNKSWEILNNFFIDVYSQLQKNNFGVIMNVLQNNLNFIDQYVIKTNVIYDTSLENKSFDNVDLKYNSLIFGKYFGLQQLIPVNSALWSTSYTFNALKTGLIMWESNGKENIKNSIITFDGNSLRDNIIYNGNTDLSTGLANIMNDSYTKASKSSLKKYENFINISKQKSYSTFDELNNYLKNLTMYENDYYNQIGSTIFLKDSIEAIKNYYGLNNEFIKKLENQILNLFNITYLLTDDNFKYFLIGFLFSPDSPLLGQLIQTAGYTTYSFQGGMSWIKQYISTEYAYIIISTKDFNNILYKNINSFEYKMGWWSSPNIFCTLNHEMGHVVDAYYGMIKKARNGAKNNFKNILNNTGIKGQYKGNVFGYDNIVNYNQKVNIIKIILIVIFGFFCTIIIIAIISGSEEKK